MFSRYFLSLVFWGSLMAGSPSEAATLRDFDHAQTHKQIVFSVTRHEDDRHRDDDRHRHDIPDFHHRDFDYSSAASFAHFDRHDDNHRHFHDIVDCGCEKKTIVAGDPVSAVPLPASLPLFGLGMLALGLLRRRIKI